MSEKNFVGEVWKKIPGTAAVLTGFINILLVYYLAFFILSCGKINLFFVLIVSLCDEVWVLDSYGNLLRHSEKTLNVSDSLLTVTDAKCVLGEDDGEWEMV